MVISLFIFHFQLIIYDLHTILYLEYYTPKPDMFLYDMDLDVDIENISFPQEEDPTTENVPHISTVVVQDEIFSDEENFVVQNASFDKDSRKMIFERTSKSKRGKTRSTIDTQNMLPSKLSSIHKVTGHALEFSIANTEEYNY